MSVCQEFNDYLNRHVPLFRAMQGRLERCDADGVAIRAPLEPNLNDKGIAFGGSMAAIAALSGWALTAGLLRQHGESAEILIGECQLKFLRPVRGEIIAEGVWPEAAISQSFVDSYRTRGKARWSVEVLIRADGEPAMTFTGQYAALRPQTDEQAG